MAKLAASMPLEAKSLLKKAGALDETFELLVSTIGIGAGPHCDGQILVIHDILGWGKTRFGKTYADVRAQTAQAVEAYVQEVRAQTFPTKEHAYE